MPRLSNEYHERIARTYVQAGCNLSEAGRRLGVDSSTIHALVNANPTLKARIAELHEMALKRADITADRVMLELGRLAFADIRQIFGPDGQLVHPADLGDDAAATLSGIETEAHFTLGPPEEDLATGETKRPMVKVVTTKVKRYDKNAALNTLAKHFKLVNDEGDGVNALASALADQLKAGRRRAGKE